MTCPHCLSTSISKRQHRTSLGYRTFPCRVCRLRFNERTGGWVLPGRCFHTELIQSVGFLRILWETAKAPSHDPPGGTAVGMAAASLSTLRRIPVAKVAPAYCPSVSRPMLSAPLPAASSASARRFSSRGWRPILPLLHTLHSKPSMTCLPSENSRLPCR